jgi:hypothetical protein
MICVCDVGSINLILSATSGRRLQMMTDWPPFAGNPARCVRCLTLAQNVACYLLQASMHRPTQLLHLAVFIRASAIVGKLTFSYSLLAC